MDQAPIAAAGSKPCQRVAGWTALRLAWLCLLAGGLAGGLAAGEAGGLLTDSPYYLGPPGGDELLQFEEFPTVVTATRQANSSNLSAVPVSVITSRRIHNSGATTIPELLQYAPGMDVLKVDRNHTAIGINGMFTLAKDRILGLVDGVKSSNAINGYTDYQRYPIFLEDIQQIEIVRGPSGAAWGANAFSGVINILTKDPLDTQGFLVQANADEMGDTLTHARWGSRSGGTRWRISAGYLNQIPSSVALNRDFPFDDGTRQATVDSKLVYEPAEGKILTAGLAYTHSERQAMTFLGYQPKRDENVDEVRSYARYKQTLGESASTTWTASFNYADELMPSLYRARSLETGLDGQWDYQGFQDHELTIGGSARYDYGDQFHIDTQDFQFANDPNQEFWGGLYLVDRWQVATRAWLEFQGRGDWFQFNQPGRHGDWSGRLSAIVAADEAQNHVFRLSGAKSYRAPTMLLRATSVRRILLPSPPFPPNTFAANVANGSGLNTETVWSAEAGYSGRLGGGFDLQANTYYQRYLRLLSVELRNVAFPQSFYEIDNIEGAFGWGGTLELRYRMKSFEFSAWYAYNGFREERDGMILRASPPSPNKVGVTAEWQPAENWVSTLNYRYADLTPGDIQIASTARAFHQLDIAILRQFPALHGEFLLGVSDIFNNTAIAVRDISSTSSAHPTPGRRFIGRFQIEF